MRFPRQAKMFCGQLDAAPFAGVFFCLLILLLLNSSLVFTPGVRVDLPVADHLPGVANPTVVVAVDRSGQFYYLNQAITAPQLQARLTAEAAKYQRAKSPLTLVVQADKAAAYEVIIGLVELARVAGIHDVLQATRPSFTSAP